MLLIFNIIIGLLIALFMQHQWLRHIKRGISLTTVYSFEWVIIWVVFFSGIMGYDELSWRTILFSLIPVLGSTFGEAIAIKSWCKQSFTKNCFEKKSIDLNKFKTVMIVLAITSLLVGFAIFYSSFQIYGNVIDNAQLIKEQRMTYGTMIHEGTTFGKISKFSDLLMGLLFATVILGGIYTTYLKRVALWPIVLPLIGSILYCFGWGSRSQVFTVLLIYISIFLIAPIKNYNFISFFKTNRIFLVFFILVISVTIYLLNLIGTSTRQKETIIVNNIEMPFSFVQLVDYNIGILACFDKTIDDNKPTYGRMSFHGIEQWLRLLRIIPNSWALPEELIKWELEYPYMGENRRGNTYTWLKYLYSDFGLLGLFLIPLIISLIGTKAAFNYYQSNDLKYLCINCICSLLFLRSTVIMWTRDENFFLMIGAIAFSIYLVQKRNLQNVFFQQDIFSRET